MSSRIHGLISLSLMYISLAIGLFYVISDSRPLGLFYLALILLAPLVVVYAFCAKCPCRLDNCGHYLPGQLTKLFPPRKQGPYTGWDISGVAVPLAALLIFPQFWLWQNKIMLVIFWSLFIIALTEVKLFVCRGCGNEKCPVHPGRA